MKPRTLSLSLAVLSLLSCLAASAAETKQEPGPRKKLELNRSMMRRLSGEYETLRAAGGDATPFIRHEMVRLKFQMQALDEDAERLEAMLPPDEGARRFLSSVVSKARSRPAVPAGMTRRQAALHEEALRFVAEKKYGAAQAIYGEILLDHPDDDQAHLILGHLGMLTGDYEGASLRFADAVRIEPANRSEIKPFYENFVIADPEDDQAYARLGYAYLFLDEPERAAESFYDALSLNSENLDAVAGLAALEAGASPA